MTLDAGIREAVEQGCQVHIWPEHFGGGFCAIVRGPHGCRHTSRTGPDPIVTLTSALVEDHRLRGDAERAVALTRDPRQIELEDAIAEAVGAGDYQDLLG